ILRGVEQAHGFVVQPTCRLFFGIRTRRGFRLAQHSMGSECQDSPPDARDAIAGRTPPTLHRYLPLTPIRRTWYSEDRSLPFVRSARPRPSRARTSVAK